MSLARRVAYNTITQVAGKIASTVLGLFSLALITRYLGPQGFGEYTTILTFLGFFAIFADFGITLITVQLITEKKDQKNKILNNLFALRLLSIIIFLSLAPLIAIFLPYSASVKGGLIIAMGAFIFPALNQVIIGLFQKKLCMEKNAISETIGKLTLLAGILLGEKLSLGLNGILLATSIAAFISFALHYLFSLKHAFITLEWDFSLWKKIAIRFWPLAVAVILNLVYLRGDTLLLSLFKSAEDVGFYGAPYKIIDVLSTLPFMFAGLIMPMLSHYWIEKSSNNFKKVLQKSLDLMFIIAIPVIIGTQFVAVEIINIIAGSEYLVSNSILKILIIAIIAIFPGTIFSHAVIAIDKQKKMIPFYIFTSATSLLAYLILIPKFSYYGAAAVTIYSELSIALFSAYCVYKYSGFKYSVNKLFKSIFSGAIMALFIIIFLKHYSISLSEKSLGAIVNLALLTITSASLYFISMILIKGIDRNDLKLLLRKQNKSGGQSFRPGTDI